MVSGGGAARPLDQRAVLVHAGRLQRARQRDPRADRALAQAGAARRAARRVRGHRGGGGLGSVAHQDHGSAHRGRLGDRRREVVRHLRRRGRGLHRYGQRARGRPDTAHAVSGRPLARRDRDRGQPALHAHLSARASGGALHGRRGGRGRGHRRPRRRRGPPARVVHRGAAGDRRPGRGLDVAADRGDDCLGARARAGREPDHGLPGRVVPAGRLRRRRRRRTPAHPRGGAPRGRRAPTRRSCTPRRRWPSCS